jgi:glutamate racemase
LSCHLQQTLIPPGLERDIFAYPVRMQSSALLLLMKRMELSWALGFKLAYLRVFSGILRLQLTPTLQCLDYLRGSSKVLRNLRETLGLGEETVLHSPSSSFGELIVQTDLRPIGMLDSGVGGLSILREVRHQMPGEDVLFFADQGHVPYGPRPLEEIRQFARGITQFLLDRQVKAIVVACNAASAAALHHLRETFPGIPFVGMEPAVKPAAENTRSGTIGVITTKATYQGELFASVIDRYANGVSVVTQVCPDFVTLVEAGLHDTDTARGTARQYLAPLLEAGIDQLVLGCTHFPFLTPVLQEVVGPDVTIVDPSGAVARQTERIISRQRNASTHAGRVTYYTSSRRDRFLELAARLMNEPVQPEQVVAVRWEDGMPQPV